MCIDVSLVFPVVIVVFLDGERDDCGRRFLIRNFCEKKQVGCKLAAATATGRMSSVRCSSFFRGFVNLSSKVVLSISNVVV